MVPPSREFHDLWLKTSFSKFFKNRRKNLIEKIYGGFSNKKLKILEVGCGSGKDFISFYDQNDQIEFTGVDLDDYGINQKNFKFLKLDAESLPFKDKEFDLVISLGLLEHIVPIEKLSKIIKEIDRVGKSYVMVVPAVNTILEPHTKGIFWQLKDHNKKKKYKHAPLNYFSDDVWPNFEGFAGAKVKRFWHIPFLVCDLIISKVPS